MTTAPKKKILKKHPKEMTTEEALRHVFHPKIVKHLKTQAKELNRDSTNQNSRSSTLSQGDSPH
jgi:hypothetical protein